MADLTIEEIEQNLPPRPPLARQSTERFPGDDSATWRYWTRWDLGTEVSDIYVWERLRLRRNELLAACDFRVSPDVPWDSAPWIEYRQALRDLPDSTNDPRQVVWPEPPQ